MAVSRQEPKQELEEILEKAIDFHAHLGPFLVLGVRMGFIALRELKAKKDDPKLRVTVSTKLFVPFSCVIDGVQVATKCTVGNRRLKLQDSPTTISTRFEILERHVMLVTLNPAEQEKLERLLSKHPTSQEIERIAHNILLTPDKELFIVEKKTLSQ